MATEAPIEAPTSTHAPRLLLITYFRTASNLFLRMLDIPDRHDVLTVDNAGYFFFPALLQMNKTKMLERGWDAASDAEKLALEQAYQACFDKLQGLVSAGQSAKKTILVKEHAPFLMPPRTLMRMAHGQDDNEPAWKVQCVSDSDAGTTPLCGPRCNPSVIPDSVLSSWTPVFLVRHPALAFPSYYRMMLGMEKGDAARMTEIEPKLVATMTLRWTRELFEWYVEAGVGKPPGAGEPIVLDADDFQREPQLVARVCERVGLDASVVRSSWDPATEEEVQRENPFWRHSKTTLFGSSGVLLGKTFEGRSLEGEVVDWVEEFGEADAMKLKGWVEGAMEDYEYLRSKRLTL